MSLNWAKKEYPDQTPGWCSVDFGVSAQLRHADTADQKRLFQMLKTLGIHEILVGTPAKSDTDLAFLRILSKDSLIADDLRIQVCSTLDQVSVQKTLGALAGIRQATIHLCKQSSCEGLTLQDVDRVRPAIDEALRSMESSCAQKEWDLCPELTMRLTNLADVPAWISFCNDIRALWTKQKKKSLIFNFTEGAAGIPPHVFASCIEEITEALRERKEVIVSIRPRRAAFIYPALLAGVRRVEGVIFGTGTDEAADLPGAIAELADYGLTPGLPEATYDDVLALYEEVTHLQTDATDNRKSQDTLRATPDLIPDINYGIALPQALRKEFEAGIKSRAGDSAALSQSGEVMAFFEEEYLHPETPFQYIDVSFVRQDGQTLATITIETGEGRKMTSARGNGLLDAVSNAYMQFFSVHYRLETYEEHALGQGSAARALSFVSIKHGDLVFWGAGINEDISRSSIAALSVAVGRLCRELKDKGDDDNRIDRILNYIKDHYRNVTLDELSGVFFLSKPYLSKYIKEKSGRTFGDNLKYIRLQKAEHLLKNTNMKIEQVAGAAGYQNVEHFNRMFKKEYGCTPVQYRSG